MGESLRPYRDAIAARVHAICLDRNLNPASSLNTESTCRIDQYLSQLIEVANAIGQGDPAAFNAAVEKTICLQCGQLDALGTCRVREQAECCLYRYLPLIYDAIHQVPLCHPDHIISVSRKNE